MIVIVSTAAQGTRAAGLTVQVRGERVTGIAVCPHLRRFDLCARLAAGSARPAGRVLDDIVDEIAARVASLIDLAAE